MLRQLFDSESCTYTYLISDSSEKYAIIIDPVKSSTKKYLKLISELSLVLTATLDTHTHADHITASGMLSMATGCEIVMGDASSVSGVTCALPHGGMLTFGKDHIICLHTPGHTPDSCCFYSAEEGFVLTGDTLLIRGTGRTDFQEGCAQQAWHSLTTVLAALPGITRVYPGHDYNGMTVSTLAEEKQHNPRLQAVDAEAYAKIMDALNLPYPGMIDVALPANLTCGLSTDEESGDKETVTG